MNRSRSTMPYIYSDWHWSLDQTCDLPVWILYEEHNIFWGHDMLQLVRMYGLVLDH